MDITEAVILQFERLRLRVSVIAYRDIADEPNVQVFPFSEDVNKSKEFLKKLTAHGGGDLPEDIPGGFEAALNQDWNA